jgi:hypothetical protein
MISRISLSLLLVISVIILPWWVSLVFLVSALLFFPWYYESVGLILIYELLYRPVVSGWSGSILWLSLGTLILVPIIEWLKSRLYVFHH